MTTDKRSTSEYLSRLSAPLVTPQGMGDVIPPFAAEQRELSRRLLSHFELSGYELVTPPLFEHAAVIDRGRVSQRGPRELLRFVEPETSEVVVLRPDITPQIARIVATRLRERPAPYRLSYEGRVLQRRLGRARKHRQMAQVGVECIGIPSPVGDVETIALATTACQAIGLRDFRVELCSSALVSPLIESLPSEIQERVAEHVASKDRAALRETARDEHLPATTVEHLEALLDHYGDLSVLRSAQGAFAWPSAQAALAELQAITERLVDLGLASQLRVDLSETRGLAYYTGASFQILAEGPGEPICSGGRYDNLLSRFGAPYPATGFALYVDNLQWALKRAGEASQQPTARFAVALGEDGRAGETLAAALRAEGRVAALVPAASSADVALAFARGWGYAAALVPQLGGFRAIRTADGRAQDWSSLTPTAFAALSEWATASED